MPLKLPWAKEPADPYWDIFMNRAPADPNNLPTEGIRRAKEGSVYPVQVETHTPPIMAQHLKDLAVFYGAHAVGIVQRADASDGLPYAVLCALRAPADPRTALGFGGQTPALFGAFVTFNLGSSIREFGFRCTKAGTDGAERLAVAAGLGTHSADGRVVHPTHGPLYLADVLLTDLPIAPDGKEAR